MRVRVVRIGGCCIFVKELQGGYENMACVCIWNGGRCIFVKELQDGYKNIACVLSGSVDAAFLCKRVARWLQKHSSVQKATIKAHGIEFETCCHEKTQRQQSNRDNSQPPNHFQTTGGTPTRCPFLATLLQTTDANGYSAMCFHSE